MNAFPFAAWDDISRVKLDPDKVVAPRKGEKGDTQKESRYCGMCLDGLQRKGIGGNQVQMD